MDTVVVEHDGIYDTRVVFCVWFLCLRLCERDGSVLCCFFYTFFSFFHTHVLADDSSCVTWNAVSFFFGGLGGRGGGAGGDKKACLLMCTARARTVTQGAETVRAPSVGR